MKVEKKRLFLVSLLFMLMLVTSVCAVGAAEESDPVGFTQIRKAGKYYWENPNGKIRTKAGWFDVEEDTYYLAKGGACYTGYKTIGGKLYYFTKKGALRKSTGWFKGTKYTYYYRKNHSLATGRVKIGDKYYIFNAKNGRLQKNKSSIKIGSVYYKTDKNGVATKLDTPKIKCALAARKFINQHSSSSSSKATRFRSCFNYLLGRMAYTPGYYSVREDYAKIDKKNFQYTLALETFNASNLRGNCHRFACCIAAIAAELGYDPYVVVTTGDHSFVMINGLYYDNMGAKFAAPSREPYSVYKKVKM